MVRLPRGRAARGVAAIEMAILLVPLMTVTFGATEIGRAIYTYNTLDKAVRDAARYVSQHGSGDTVIQANATCLAIKGNLGCTGAALAPGLTASNVTLCDPIACPTNSKRPSDSASAACRSSKMRAIGRWRATAERNTRTAS